jgi:hypothetical protein
MANTTPAQARCYIIGEPYTVRVYLTTQTWNHWIELTDAGYLQASVFSETTALQHQDIPGLWPCPA